MQAFARAVTPLRVEVSREPARFGGEDIQDTIAAGVPVVEIRQDMSRYFDLHHSADDTLDKVSPDGLAQSVAVWATFLATAADSDIDFRAPAAADKRP
jgi:Zn-dependent M28 family amino/carboxypeptidase